MTHGTNRVYKVQLEGKDQTSFATIRVDEDLRPKIGDQIKLREKFPNEIFKITRTIPAGNPGKDGMIYIVEHESDRNLVAGGDTSDGNSGNRSLPPDDTPPARGPRGLCDPRSIVLGWAR